MTDWNVIYDNRFRFTNVLGISKFLYTFYFVVFEMEEKSILDISSIRHWQGERRWLHGWGRCRPGISWTGIKKNITDVGGIRRNLI